MHTRRKILAVGITAAALGLAACGVEASIKSAVSSLGASPYLQVHLTGSVSGPGTTQAQQVLGALTIDVDASSATGAPLSSSEGKVDTGIVVNVAGNPLADLRVVGTNIYLEVDVSEINNIPNVHVSPQELSELQLVLGGRWFELPESTLKQLTPKEPTPSSRQIQSYKADEQEIVDSLTSLIGSTPYRTLAGGGYAQTGSLQAVVNAVLPTVDRIAGRQIHPSAVHGSYTIGMTMSGLTATGGSIEITAPSGSGGNASVGVHATVTHNTDAVVAPTGATVITPSLLKSLLAQSGSSDAL